MSSIIGQEKSGRYYQLWVKYIWPRFSKTVGDPTKAGMLGLKMPTARTAESNDDSTVTSKNNKEYLDWWQPYIAGLIRGVLARGLGPNTAIVLGFLSLYIPALSIVVGIVSFLARESPFLASITAILAFILLYHALRRVVNFVIYNAYLTLKMMPPDEYAAIAISGKGPSYVFRALSYEMREGCREFAHQAEPLLDIALAAVQGNSTSSNLLEEAEKALAKFDSKQAIRHESWQRLHALKTLAADQLLIPRRRLCRHVLEYSPTTHWELSQTFQRLFQSIINEIEDKPDRVSDEMCHHYMRMKLIVESFEKRRKILEQFFLATYLYNHVHRIASRRSTSGTILEYAGAVKMTIRATSGQEPEVQMKHLLFLYRKQQAYSGFDVNASCIRLLLHCDGPQFNSKSVSAQKKVLTSLEKAFLEANEGTRSKILHKIGGDTLKALESLPLVVKSHVFDTRKKVADNFHKYCEENTILLGDPVFITHGYSKIVRTCFSKLVDMKIPAKVFFLDSGEEESDETKKAVYEMRELDSGGNLVVTSGEEDGLSKLVEPDTPVVLVVGAECFDSKLRVIHARGAAKRIEELHRHFCDEKIKVSFVAVAEEYKYHPGSLINDPLFFKYHLNKLDVYRPTVVITSDRIEYAK